jgi:hypothetical protein
LNDGVCFTISAKPKKRLSFQQKIKSASKKAMALNDNIPYEYNKPQIKAEFHFDY